ncbi:ABC transporter ATP-binding protein [Fervidobacterium riparium]|uniref:Amino acid/amide ABC transporter ATP-binding protein 2, HAAT family (TC 3.A.1.4.-) n=2 Tax=Fervidobacteriaceae TaxID=1643950 RepID=A0A1M7RXH9_FERGO|nr:ABC transporter ATP-binding protein [Fervidobacterium gondwanense]UXF00078.1 amino acid ABC transporter ATPase [Fervidobacterium riparium]SHN50844.1 amino acid/amide ABC transporter ATP-binding protein 2, HAAT family (TC 3.A.1.4.-) [Fervidobacterium gondwanense DSM 13020]
MKMLEIMDLHVHYGGIHALKGISMKVEEGQIISLIGANGAGKSTTLRTICGLKEATRGSIKYKGKELTKLDTSEIVKMGITMVPEGRRVFSNLTVYENLLAGAYLRKDKEEIKKDIEYVFDLFPRLRERTNQRAGTLSGGEQQMLAIGRALMSRPKLLLFDEPSLGLAPVIVKEVFQMIKKIHSEGVTIFLVEQNAYEALKLSDYAYVLETGRIVLEGTGKDLLEDERVRKAYLGG